MIHLFGEPRDPCIGYRYSYIGITVGRNNANGKEKLRLQDSYHSHPSHPQHLFLVCSACLNSSLIDSQDKSLSESLVVLITFGLGQPLTQAINIKAIPRQVARYKNSFWYTKISSPNKSFTINILSHGMVTNSCIPYRITIIKLTAKLLCLRK